jgi:hypothetical protein
VLPLTRGQWRARVVGLHKKRSSEKIGASEVLRLIEFSPFFAWFRCRRVVLWRINLLAKLERYDHSVPSFKFDGFREHLEISADSLSRFAVSGNRD